jgi:hypothetical protein
MTGAGLVSRAVPPAFRGELGVALLAALVGLLAAVLAVTAGTLALALPVALAAAVALLRNPAVLLAIFLYTPFFEQAPGLRDLPFDPTPALAALLLLAFVLRLGRAPLRRPPTGFLIPVLVIGVALLVGLLWSADLEYGRDKVLKYFTVTLIAALAPFVVLTTRKALRQFLITIVAGGLLVAVLTPILPPTVALGLATEYDTQGRYSFGGQIFPSRFLCTGALVLVLWPAFGRGGLRWAGPLLAVGVIVIAIGFGARGPFVAFALALLAVVLPSLTTAFWVSGCVLRTLAGMPGLRR